MPMYLGDKLISAAYVGQTPIGRALVGADVVSEGVESPDWILAAGVWNDDGVWDDTAIWKDEA